MLVQITSQWQSLNTLSGVSVGAAMLVQSQSSSRVYVKQQLTKPTQYSLDAAILDFKDVWKVTSGSLETWIKTDSISGQIYVEAQ